MKYAKPLPFFRTKSAIRFSPMKPKWNAGSKGNEVVERVGAFLVEIAPAKGRQSYDWEKKLSFALTCAEAVSMFPMLKTEKGYRAMHDPGAGTENSRQVSKWFTAKLMPKGGGIAMSVNMKGKDGETLSHSIVVDGLDVLLLKNMIEGTVPYMFGWVQSFTDAPKEAVLQLTAEPDFSAPEAPGI